MLSHCPLGETSTDIKDFAVSCWRAAVAGDDASPDARVGLAEALLTAASSACCNSGSIIPVANNGKKSRLDRIFDRGDEIPNTRHVEDGDYLRQMGTGGARFESGAMARAKIMVAEAVAQCERAMNETVAQRPHLQEEKPSLARPSLSAASSRSHAPSGSSMPFPSDSSGDYLTAFAPSDEHEKVGQAVLLVVKSWFFIAPTNDIPSATKLLKSVIGSTYPSSSAQRLALEMLAALSLKITECAVAQCDLLEAIGMQTVLFDHSTHAAAARRTVQALVVGLVSCGRGKDAAECTAQLNNFGYANESIISKRDRKHHDLMASSVADTVRATADHDCMERRFIEAKSGYLQALSLHPGHVASLLGLLALAKAFAFGEQDMQQALPSPTIRGSAPDPDTILPIRLIMASKQRGLLLCRQILHYVSSSFDALSAFGDSRLVHLHDIQLQSANLYFDIMESADIACLLLTSPPLIATHLEYHTSISEGYLQSSELSRVDVDIKAETNVEVVNTLFDDDRDIERSIDLFEELLGFIAMQPTEASFYEVPSRALQELFVRVASSIQNITCSVVSLATERYFTPARPAHWLRREAPNLNSRTEEASLSQLQSVGVGLGSERWAFLLQIADQGYSKLLGQLSNRWATETVPRCSEHFEKSIATRAAEKIPRSITVEPSTPARAAFALHMIEILAYSGLMDILDAKLVKSQGCPGILSRHHNAISIPGVGVNVVMAEAVPTSNLPPSPMALVSTEEAEDSFCLLLDRLTDVAPGSSFGSSGSARFGGSKLPIPVTLAHLTGRDGPVFGGWWTPIGLAGREGFSGFAKMRTEETAIKSRRDTTGEYVGVDDIAWVTAGPSAVLRKFAELQRRALGGVLAGVERRAYSATEVNLMQITHAHIC